MQNEDGLLVGLIADIVNQLGQVREWHTCICYTDGIAI